MSSWFDQLIFVVVVKFLHRRYTIASSDNLYTEMFLVIDIHINQLPNNVALQQCMPYTIEMRKLRKIVALSKNCLSVSTHVYALNKTSSWNVRK